jgi:hypothetical protein
MEIAVRIIRVKVRLLIALVLLSLASVVNANEVDSVTTVPRLLPGEFAFIPVQVKKTLTELGCTIPQASYFPKGKSNVISGSFAKRGQIDYAVLCSRNGMSHIQVVWGGQARCESALQVMEDSIFTHQEDSGNIEYSRVLGVTPQRAIVKLLPADDGPKLSAPYHEAIQDAYVEKASTIFYCENGKWHELEGAD